MLLGPVSCMKIDNFEAPSAKIQGKIIDKTTSYDDDLEQDADARKRTVYVSTNTYD